MSAMEEPQTGSPCWVEVPALDIKRAKAFYADVWGWNFKPNPPGDANYSEDCMAMFAYPGDKLMGGIMKKEEASIGKTKTGVMVYLYAKNIDEQIEKIKKGNGKLVGEKRKEGEHGMIQEFEDTEGNLCATYAMVNKQACPQQENQGV